MRKIKRFSSLLIAIIVIVGIATGIAPKAAESQIVYVGTAEELIALNNKQDIEEIRITKDLDFAGLNYEALSLAANTITGYDLDGQKAIKRTIKNIKFTAQRSVPGDGIRGLDFNCKTFQNINFEDMDITYRTTDYQEYPKVIESKYGTHWWSIVNAKIVENVEFNNIVINNKEYGCNTFELIRVNRASKDENVANTLNNVKVSNITYNSLDGTKYSQIAGITRSEDVSINNCSVSNVVVNGEVDIFQGIGGTVNSMSNSYLKNVTINKDIDTFCGLFDIINFGTVENCYVKDINIKGQAYNISGFGYVRGGSIRNSFASNITLGSLKTGGSFSYVTAPLYWIYLGENEVTDLGGVVNNTTRLNNIYVDITDNKVTSPINGTYYPSDGFVYDKERFGDDFPIIAKNVFYTDEFNSFDNKNLLKGMLDPIDSSLYNVTEVNREQLKSNEIVAKLNEIIEEEDATKNNWVIDPAANNGLPLMKVFTSYRLSTNVVAANDKDTNISIKADAGVLPEGIKFNVTPISEGDTYKKAELALGNNIGGFTLFDINILYNDIKIQPNGKIEVRIPLPKDYANNIKVYRVEENGTLVDMNATIIDGVITFQTNHFSLYTIANMDVKEVAPIKEEISTNIVNTDNKVSEIKTANSTKTGDKQNIAMYMFLVMAGISSMGVIGYKKYLKKC